MKKLSFLLLALAAGLAGCGKPDPEPEPPLRVTPKLKIEVSECTIAPAAGSTATVSFEVNADWQTSVEYEGGDQEWLAIAPASGAAGTVALTLTASGNTRPDARRAYVTITYGGEQPYRLTVVQSGLPEDTDPTEPSESPRPTLKVEVSECTIAPAAGSTATVSFEVNTDWQASVEYEDGDEEWLAIAPASSGGSGKVNLTLTATGNTQYDTRRAYVVITYGGGPYRLTVVQSGLPYDYDLDITADFNPRFAYMLQKYGYVADANNIRSGEVKGVTVLDIRSDGLTSLRGIEYFESLTYLDCGGNQLTALDVSKNTALTTLYCYDNQLTSLDVSSNTALTTLYCDYNQLTSLDVSSNTALTRLYCDYNQLTSLDVSKNTALTALNCDYNRLTSLDVSKNTALTELWCSDNQLTSLDVSNTALTELWCRDNQLTSLDVSRNTALTKLWCNDNRLTSLDVSKNTALQFLSCSDNQLTSLDVSKNTALTFLFCSDNQLTSLDVSRNYSLTSFGCSYNPGDGTVFPVTAWFDNNNVPSGEYDSFTTGSWEYDGATITIDYRQAE